jgi:uncharacterized protein
MKWLHDNMGWGINKLVLVVNESCNLHCGYCYVRNSPHKCMNRKMDPSMARMIVKRFFTANKNCNFIQFFGGEPTLNLPAIEAAIEETNRLVDNATLRRKPRFAIVTNGVFSDFDLVIDFLKRYNIETTVSLDGPAVIHNDLRCEKSGEPTFDRVYRTISELTNTKIPIAIETVYTAQHIEKNISIIDVFKFCHETGIAKLIFDIAHPPAPNKFNPLFDPYFETLLAYYKEAVDWWFQSLIYNDRMALDVYFRELLLPLINGLPAAIAKGGCQAGESDFAVGPNGDIFVCQLFYGNPEYKIGNVRYKDVSLLKPEFPRGSDDIFACRKCPIRNWCQPCAALNLSWGDPWQPPLRECQLRKAVVFRLGAWAFSYLDVPENEITIELRKEVEKEVLPLP